MSSTKNKKLLLQILYITVVSLFIAFGMKTFAQPLPLEKDNLSRVYVFFDSGHSFVQNKDSLIPTNYITIDSTFTKDIVPNVFGSEHFCKNMFYFLDNKIIFSNPSQSMSSSVWCQVQLTHKKSQKVSNYKFILNKTFAAWCQEKDTNLSIGKTVNAVLNMFESNVCTDNVNQILASTRVLNLSNSHLDDVSPIAGFLQVRSLWLDNNEIESVESLGSMQNLVFLSLNNNLISNARSLGEIPGLRWVFLNNNQLMSIDFVHKLKTLKFLGINGNLIGDPTPLYSVSPTTYVLANDNPFIKKLCSGNTKYFNKNSSNNKNSLNKNCLESSSATRVLENNVKLLPVINNSTDMHKTDDTGVIDEASHT